MIITSNSAAIFSLPSLFFVTILIIYATQAILSRNQTPSLEIALTILHKRGENHTRTSLIYSSPVQHDVYVFNVFPLVLNAKICYLS
jgi:hypothetical protein